MLWYTVFVKKIDARYVIGAGAGVAGGVLLLVFVLLLLQAQGRVFVRGPVLFRENPTATYIVGQAELLRRDGDWESVNIGDALRRGDRLRTGLDSRLDIRFSDKAAVRLNENTQLELQKIDINEIDLMVARGRVFAAFSPRFVEQKFRVRGAYSTTNLGNADIVFDVSQQETLVKIISGTAAVYNPEFPEAEVFLYSGMGTVIKPGNQPEAGSTVLDTEIQELEHLLRNVQTEQVLLVSSSIQFEPNTDRIMEASYPELEWVVDQLQKHTYRIRIDGHTADVGAESAMQALSLARARRIQDYLIDNGIPVRRLQVRGYGGSRPITDNETSEGRARNRRVEFILID